jgi:diacylglycerol kinase (ATP)
MTGISYIHTTPPYGMAEEIQNIALLCNPIAGVGRSVSIASEVTSLLKTSGIGCQSFVGEWPTDFQGFSDVWIVGGDGTFHHFINRYPANTLPLGLIAGGTGNDFHWQLYGNQPVQALLARILTSEPRPVDLGLCNGERFINGMGIGFEGAVAKTLQGRKKRPGKASYMAAILGRILGYRSRPYRIRADGVELSGRWLMVDVNNGGRNGGGFMVAPQALPDDGWLDLMTVDAVTPLQRLRYLPIIERGRHLDLPFVQCRRVRELTIEDEIPLCFHMDGDVQEARSLQIAVLPAAVRIRY